MFLYKLLLVLKLKSLLGNALESYLCIACISSMYRAAISYPTVYAFDILCNVQESHEIITLQCCVFC